jgi:hypothetical protein
MSSEKSTSGFPGLSNNNLEKNVLNDLKTDDSFEYIDTILREYSNLKSAQNDYIISFHTSLLNKSEQYANAIKLFKDLSRKYEDNALLLYNKLSTENDKNGINTNYDTERSKQLDAVEQYIRDNKLNNIDDEKKQAIVNIATKYVLVYNYLLSTLDDLKKNFDEFKKTIKSNNKDTNGNKAYNKCKTVFDNFNKLVSESKINTISFSNFAILYNYLKNMDLFKFITNNYTCNECKLTFNNVSMDVYIPDIEPTPPPTLPEIITIYHIGSSELKLQPIVVINYSSDINNTEDEDEDEDADDVEGEGDDEDVDDNKLIKEQNYKKKANKFKKKFDKLYIEYQQKLRKYVTEKMISTAKSKGYNTLFDLICTINSLIKLVLKLNKITLNNIEYKTYFNDALKNTYTEIFSYYNFNTGNTEGTYGVYYDNEGKTLELYDYNKPEIDEYDAMKATYGTPPPAIKSKFTDSNDNNNPYIPMPILIARRFAVSQLAKKNFDTSKYLNPKYTPQDVYREISTIQLMPEAKAAAEAAAAAAAAKAASEAAAKAQSSVVKQNQGFLGRLFKRKPKPSAAATATPQPSAAATATPQPSAAATATPQPSTAATAAQQPSAATATQQPSAAATATQQPSAAATAVQKPSAAATAVQKPTPAPPGPPGSPPGPSKGGYRQSTSRYSKRKLNKLLNKKTKRFNK